ncbi:hypothetical protein HK102_003781 [Quaeritorhiza haematococci]|nr:hypothetical protein HK102_003781 [Quaeritorhiza haematococci]
MRGAAGLFLTLLIAVLASRTAVAQNKIPLKIGYLNVSIPAFAESYRGGFRSTSVDELFVMFEGLIKMAMNDIQKEGVLADFEIQIVQAYMESNTQSAVYKAANDLIQQVGFRIPVLTFQCPILIAPDNPCFATQVTELYILQYFKAAQRLGFKNALVLYDPDVYSNTVVESFANEVANDIKITSIQVRGNATQDTIRQIQNTRLSTILSTGAGNMKSFRLLHDMLGDRASFYSFFISPNAGPAITLETFLSGEDKGLFRADEIFREDTRQLIVDRVLNEKWAWSDSADYSTTIMRIHLILMGFRFDYLLRMWAYGFQALIKASPYTPDVIATNMDRRPPLDRVVYTRNQTLNQIYGLQVRNVSGVPFISTVYGIYEFNVTAYNLTLSLPDSRRFIAMVDGTDKITNATYGDGSATRPSDIVPLPIRSFENSSTAAAGLALGPLIIIWNFALLLLLLVLRSSLKSTSWVFMGTTLLGSMSIAAALISASLSAARGTSCTPTPVLITTGIHLVLVSIAVKAFRLNIIFRNKVRNYTAKEHVNRRNMALKDTHLAMAVLGFYIPDVILLAIWLSVEPLRPMYVEESGTQVLRCYTNKSGYAWALFAYAMVKLLVALRYTYTTRDVYSRYNETKTVLFAVYNVIIGLVLGLVSLTLSGLPKEAEMILLTIALALTSFGTSTTVVGTRVYYAVLQKVGEEESASDSQQRAGLHKSGKIGPASNHGKAMGASTAETTSDRNKSHTAVRLASGVDIMGTHGDVLMTNCFVYEGSARRRVTGFLWSARWYLCSIIVALVDSGPTLTIVFLDGSEKKDDEKNNSTQSMRAIRSVSVAQNQITALNVTKDKMVVAVDTQAGTFDIDLWEEQVASAFVETCSKAMGLGKGDSKQAI